MNTMPDAPEADETAPFTVVPGDPACGFVLTCDHAENRLPARYGTLGLGAEALERHIAWDPGARAVTVALARRLGAPAVLSRFSRLLIDPNRGRDDPTLVMRLSDRAVIPGNLAVDEAERTERIARYYAPYDDAIRRTVDVALATGTVPAIVAIHSFTPVWRGRGRPWQVGILWDADPRLAQPLIEALRGGPARVVGAHPPE
jgi:predicted N-formylglutamate amidohydrolase